VLRKREHYRKLFHDWDIAIIANMRDNELEDILLDPGIIRNRLKVYSVRKNAIAALELQKEFGSLDNYFWGFQWFYSSPEKRRLGGVSQKGIPNSVTPSNSPFSGGESLNFPIINHGLTLGSFPTESDISKIISKDLKKRGMSFIGSTIIYAWMQAVGMVDDHVDSCFRKK
jgi:DNA-3-methyladenine glycosylase I